MDLNTLRYARSHEWAILDGDVCTVGLSKFAVDQLTDIIYIELPPAGKAVTAESSMAQVESVKSVNDIYAPVSGTVAEVNKAVEQDMSLISTDPYGKGWLVKIKVVPGTTLGHLMSLAEYEKQVASEEH
jgi:glycine cleavage system H protein